VRVLAWLLLLQVGMPARLPLGELVPDVKCVSDPAQSYALFLPADYTPDRAWPVIFAFDPGARGRTPVERYQAAAAAYGYIVAGSNNSRNGSPDVRPAVNAMTSDVLSRFNVDAKRIYLAGMSGGARVALGTALGSPVKIAGVIASSAGYPDSEPRKTLPFPVFATAGTEDFNHLEMRLLDRALTTPHYLAIFTGGHTWLSSDLAMEAVEWMEIQAMRSGLAARNDREIDRILAKRAARAAPDRHDAPALLELQAIAADFQGLRDVSSFAARAAVLARDKDVRAALRKNRDEDDREMSVLVDVKSAESRLLIADARAGALLELRQIWKSLAQQAQRPADSVERRLARRVLAALSAGVTTTDAEYLRIINEYRTARGRGRGQQQPSGQR
jgi:dienelactone hydrolase